MHPRTTSIEWAGQSDPGRVRANNEDAFSIVTISAAGALTREEASGTSLNLPGGGAVFTVSDGVGGGQAGEVASAIAIESVPENIAGDELSTCFTSWDRGQRMENALRRANGRIRQESADPARAGMCATVSTLWVLPDRAVFGQSGDSRLYRYRGGELCQLSHDQSEIAALVRMGQISEADARIAPNRNVIEQALGTPEQSFAPEVDWVEWINGDVFLLCSDGLVDGLDDAQVVETLRLALAQQSNLPAVVTELIAKGNAASGKDNITVVLVRVSQTTEAVAAAPETDVRAVAPKGSGTSRSKNGLLLVAAAIAGAVIAVGAWWFFLHRPLVEAMRVREDEFRQTIQDEREMTTDVRKRQRAQAELLQQQVDSLTARGLEMNTRLQEEGERIRALEQTLAQAQSQAIETETRVRADYEARLKLLQETTTALEHRLQQQAVPPQPPEPISASPETGPLAADGGATQ